MTQAKPSRLAQGEAIGMAAGTALSRATGLARTVVLASVLGVTLLGDAYNIANTAPNMIFQLAIGGLLGSALVPMLTQSASDAERRRTAGIVLVLVTSVGVIVSTILATAAPLVVKLLTLGGEGASGHARLVAVGSTWLRFFAPQVTFYALSVVAVGVMASRRRLTLSGFAPAAANVVTIGGALAFLAVGGGGGVDLGSVTSTQVAVLGWATTAGVAAMAGLQLWGAWRAEGGIPLKFAPRDPVVGRLMRLAGWVIVYVTANQVGLAIATAMVASVEGGVSAHQWGFILTQLPYGIAAVSIYSAAFPAMCEAANQRGEITEDVAEAARLANLAIIPAAVGMATIALPVSMAVVGPGGSLLLSGAVIGFAISLPLFSLFQLLTRSCYAFQDTRTPALVNLVLNAVNLVWNALVLVLVEGPVARVAGLALGTGAAYLAGCLLLGRHLSRTKRLDPRVLLGSATRKVVLASAGMAAAVVGLREILPSLDSRSQAVIASTSLAATGILVFVVLAARLQIAEVTALLRMVPGSHRLRRGSRG